LFVFGFYTKFPTIDKSHCSPKPMIGFTAVQGFLDALSQFNIINEFEDIQRATNILQFPESRRWRAAA